MSAVRRCLRTRADPLANHEADFGDSGHGVRFAAKPLCEAMELPLSLEAVYLEEFKRSLTWASCRRPTREFWQ
jgi:hypothetical protein